MTPVRLLRRWQREAAAAWVRWRSRMPGRELRPDGNRTRQRVVFAVCASHSARVDDPRHRRAWCDHCRKATGVGIPEHVVQLIIDVLGLPFPIHRTNPTSDVTIVARTVRDTAGQPMTQRLDQVGSHHILSARGCTGALQRLVQRRGIGNTHLTGSGDRSGDQVVVQRCEVRRRMGFLGW